MDKEVKAKVAFESLYYAKNSNVPARTDRLLAASEVNASKKINTKHANLKTTANKNSSNVNAKAEDGSTALMAASYACVNKDIFDILLQKTE